MKVCRYSARPDNMNILNPKLPRFAAIAVLPLLLAMGCSGGGNGGLTNDDDDGVTGGDGDSGTPVETQTLRLGRGFGEQFESGQLDIAVASLAAGGSTTIAVTLVNQNGAARTEDFNVTFSSPCVSQGLATITSPVTSSDGQAQATYTAQGCSGEDTITASAISNGTQVSAGGVITVTAAELGSLRFISADPDNIALRGAGGAGRQETSTVIFQVRDTSGGPVRGQLVRFDLSTRVGGIELSSAAACSSADGNVQTVVQAGTVPTVVRVTAQLVSGEREAGEVCDSTANGGTNVGSSQSDELTISTGVPDFDSVSLSASVLNPEGLNIDGTLSNITMRMADRANNPVPDGTAVQFQTEGGSIRGSCNTVDGSCTVVWNSQNPRPAEQGFSNAGRANILAFAIGEENFFDLNSNGVFDGEPTDQFNVSGDPQPQQDIGEAWRDDNENGEFDDSVPEPFVDFDQNSMRTMPDTLQSSVLCNLNSGQCAVGDDGRPQLLNVYRNLTIVMSGPASQILFYDGGAQPDFDSPGRTEPVPCDSGASLNQLQCGQSYSVVVCDVNDNVIPASSSVTITADEAMLLGSTSFTVPNTNAFGGFVAGLFPQASGEEDTGLIVVSASTPSGVVSERSISVTGCAE